MVIYECVTGLVPFYLESGDEISALVKAGGRPALPAGLNSELAAIIKRCWARDPQDRPLAEELLGSLISLQRQLTNPTAAAAAAAAAAPVAAVKRPSIWSSIWCCFGGATVGEPPKPLPAPISRATASSSQAASTAPPPASEAAAAVSARKAEAAEAAASQGSPHLHLAVVTDTAASSSASIPQKDMTEEQLLLFMMQMSAEELVALMAAEADNVRVVERGLEMLRGLAVSKEGEQACLAAGAPQACVAALNAHSATSAAVCLEGLWVLRRLAARKASASACFSAGALPVTLRVLGAFTREQGRESRGKVCEQGSMLLFCLEKEGVLKAYHEATPDTAKAMLSILTSVLLAFPTSESEACTGASAAIGALAAALPEGKYEEAKGALKGSLAGHSYPRLTLTVGRALAELEAREPPPPVLPQPEGRSLDYCGPEPAAWTYAVDEGGHFFIKDAPVSVRYGHGGRWLVKHGLVGRVDATDAFFGVGEGQILDPAMGSNGVVKQCLVGTRWMEVAFEGDKSKVYAPVRRTVRYGRESSWVEVSVHGVVEVKNEFFGKDPLPGKQKKLEIKMPARWEKFQ
jgi:hypothetical protein